MSDKRKIIGLIIALLCVSSNVHSSDKTYKTDFSLTEDPVSEGGNWVNGETVGLDFTNVITMNGRAIGTQTGPIWYDDSVAILTGSWGANQTAQATVYSVNQHNSDSCNQEVELHLRGHISAHSVTGYEINFNCRQSEWAYSEIIRWNGPRGDFTYLSQKQGAEYGVANGDEIKATIVGNVINVYKNGVLINTATDNTYPTGNPGIGFYTGHACGGVGEFNADFGLTSFMATATEIVQQKIPNPPSNFSIGQ